MTRRLVIFIPLLALAAVLVILIFRSDKLTDGKASAPALRETAATSRTPDSSASISIAKHQVDFHQWIEKHPSSEDETPVTQAEHIAAGVAIARARRPQMERLIRENPEQAIAEALTLAEWAALPPDVQSLVEKPFSIVADYDFYPVCAPPGSAPRPGTPEYVAALNTGDGASLETFVYGSRRDLMSKKKLPAQGISLGKLAAMRDGALQVLAPAEVPVAREHFNTAQADSGRSFATGAPVGSEAVHAVSGGRLLVFSNQAEVTATNERLAAADSRPGLVAASSVMLLPSGAGEINWNEIETFADEQASAWTETKKKVFLIRVNFSDNAADPVSKAAAESTLNGSVSETIRAMSYQKTWIEATVSANLYTLPQPSAYYDNYDWGLSSGELLRDARNTFRANISGADSTINIGPASANTTGDGGGLGDYDIVGVTFVNIGMPYSGLAGGNNLWMQGNNSAGTYTHELGHNYGVGHASSWDTTDGSVVGTGFFSEYGDVYDIMGRSESFPTGHFHTQAKAKLDWLTSSQWADASALGSNTYRIHRIDSAATTGTLRGVRVTKAAFPAEYYWIGYRPAISNNPSFTSGAYLNWQRAGETRCCLLDTTPNSAGGKSDAGLVVGRTYADAAANVYITPLAIGGAGADRFLDVRVNVGSFPGNQPPTAATITGPDTVAARSNATFSLSASDGNGDTLAYFWDSADGAINANAASITRQWTVGGSYTLNATVNDMKGGVTTVAKSITVTDPIDTWTQHSVGTTGNLRAVAWGKGRFVAANYYGAMAMSWDSVTWTSSGDAPAFDREPVIAFGNNVFVVGGKKDGLAEAQLCYSTDGRIWMQASFPPGIPQVRAIAFGSGKFLALADDGNVLSSTDGATWTGTSVGAAPDFRSVTWDGTTWQAVAMNAAGTQVETVWTSMDGIAWSQQSALGFFVINLFSANGVSYALGSYGGIVYSTDHGLNWTDALLPGGTRWSTYHMAAADDGTLFVTAKAMDESGAPHALLVSTNGTQWTRSTANSGNTAVGNAQAITFGAGRFLTVENGGIVRACSSFHPNNNPPIPTITAHPTTLAARQTALYAAVSSDADGDALTYVWDFGPQTSLSDGGSTVHSFDCGGSYTVTLRVIDSRGGVSVLTENITVTDPIDTWTQHSVGTTGSLRAVAWGKGRFVAADYWGAMAMSWDGVTWISSGDAPAFDREPVIAFGNNVFVVGGKKDGLAEAQLCYSTDGRFWTQASFPPGIPQVRAIAFGSGKFLALADDGNVLSSTDGVTWTGTSVGAAPDFRFVTWDGTTWQAVAMNAAGTRVETVWTSMDGIAWSQQSALGFIVYNLFSANGVSYALGWYGGIVYSTDHGLSWTDAFLPGGTRWSTFDMAAADDGTLFVTAEAMDESGFPNALLVSTNGTQWTRSTANSGNVAVGNADAITFGAGRFLTVENGGIVRACSSFHPNNNPPVPTITAHPATLAARQTALYAAVSADADGDALTYVWDFGPQTSLIDGASTIRSFDFGGNYTTTLRVIDSRGGVSVLTENITVTDPVRIFTQRTSGTTKDLNAIAANANLAVTVGGRGGVIRTSPDGVTWTTRTVSSSTNIDFRSATWDGAKFIIVGQDYNFTSPAGGQGVIYTSPDGVNWTRRFGGGTERNNELQAVASDGSGSVAVGNNGTVLASADGLSWSPVTVAGVGSSTLIGAAWSGSGYAITGYAGAGSGIGKVYTSTNRTDWIDRSAGAGLDSWQDLSKIAWLNNRFVASGWYSKLRTSIDQAVTFSTTRTDDEETPALAHGDGIYFTAGINRSASSADVDIMSLDGNTWISLPAPTTNDRKGAVFFKHTFITVGAGGSIWQSGDTTPDPTTNHAPTFAGQTTATPYETTTSISLVALLASASDEDGDALFATATGVSAQGGGTRLQAASILYTPPAGFTGTDTFPVTITDEHGLSVTGIITVTVESNTGSLTVNLGPLGAVSAGAQWQVDGGAFQNSGATVSGLSASSHTVTFNTVSGWPTPANQNATINANLTTTLTGTYVAEPQTGALTVNLGPSGAVSAGAQWQVDGGAFQNSGATVSGLSAGSHTVTFNTVSGWTTPVSHNATINANLTTTLTGTYVVATYTVTPSAGANGSISPNTVQTVNSGSNVLFTATPAANYVVNQWLVNSSVVQTGGNTYTVSNVTSDKTVQVTFSFVSRPSNDDFVNQITIPNTGGTVTGSNIGGTKESGEPSNAGGASLWWSWTADTNAKVTIQTVGSNFDTLLGVYIGTAVDSLTEVAADDDSGSGTTSSVTFATTAGTTYRIAVGGYGGQGGAINLTVIPGVEIASYTGLLNGGFASAGYGKITLKTTAKRNVTGKVFADGRAFPFSGVVSPTSSYTRTFTYRSNGFIVQPVLNVQIQNDGTFGGTWDTGNGVTYAVAGEKNGTGTKVQPIAQAGRYTAHLRGENITPGGGSVRGYLLATVGVNGATTFIGALPDGKKLSSSSHVSVNGGLPVMFGLYQAKAGYLFGSAAITGTGNARVFAAVEDLRWFKPQQTRGIYASGIPKVSIKLAGHVWTKPVSGFRLVRDFDAGVGKMQVTLSAGDLTTGITKDVNLTTRNTVTAPRTAERLTMTVTPGTGFFAGTFRQPNGITRTFKGVFVQEPTGPSTMEGYFPGVSVPGLVTITVPAE